MTRFTKGHGTQNDFILLPDLDGGLELGPAAVRALTDRHAGIGADGVIRVIPTVLAGEPEIAALASQAEWFMDYRNADGSVAQMCGNGTRVFAAYLRREGLATTDSFSIATRSGVKTIRFEGDQITTGMGSWRLTHLEQVAESGSDCLVHLHHVTAPLSAVSLDLGNPHTVAALPGNLDLDAVDLRVAPLVKPEPLAGTNVELVRPLESGHLRMRVYERGVGETRSCGTGVCAAALAVGVWGGGVAPGSRWRVDVPGGTLWVTALADQQVALTGPAALVADGETNLV